MRRIAVIGNGGGGKSTLCRTLGERLGVPVHEVDRVQFRPDWSQTPPDEVERVLDGWLRADAWIVDGFGPWPAIERRLAAADTVVWVDFPLRTHLWWTAKRQIRWRRTADGRGRPSTRLMFATILRVHRRLHGTIESAVRARPEKLVHVRSPRELRDFLENAGAKR